MRFFNFFKSKVSVQYKKFSESEYYENLFIENSLWNKPEPNQEEILRWEIIEKFVKYSKSNFSKKEEFEYNILDLGCGRGWLTNLLSKYGEIKGIEPVESVVNYAKKLFPTIDFVVGTSKDLLNDKNKYDLIVSSEVIEHISNDKKDDFINDIDELLNEKGFLILTTPRKEAQKDWNKYISSEQPIEEWISESELELLLLKHNFKKIIKERIEIAPIVSSPKIEIYQLWLFQKQ